MAVYEALVTLAEALDQDEIVGLLKETLQEADHTADEVKKLSGPIFRESATPAAQA